jgi:hypothetical protein
MSERALFITEQGLKEYSLIDENLSMDKIRPTILVAQDMYLQPILGTDLYNEINDQIIDDDLSANNITLLRNYIKPCLVYYIMMELPVAISYKYVNRDLTRNNGEGSNYASLAEIREVTEKNRIKAEFYGERLVKYLIANEGNYPLYSANSTIDKMLPIRSAYTLGLILDDCHECSGKFIGNRRESDL